MYRNKGRTVAYILGLPTDGAAQLVMRLRNISVAPDRCVDDLPDDADLIVVGPATTPAELRRYRDHCPNATLAVVDHGLSADDVAARLLAGANAVIDLGADGAALAHGLTVAMRDGSYVPPHLQAPVLVALAARKHRTVLGERVERLTPKERQILDLLTAGADRAAVAARLGESVSRVRARIDRAKAKLGVSSQRQAVAMLTDYLSQAG